MLDKHIVKEIMDLGKHVKGNYGLSERVYKEVTATIPMVYDTGGVPNPTKFCHAIYAAMPDTVKEPSTKMKSKFLKFSVAEKMGNQAAVGLKSLEAWVKRNLETLFPGAPHRAVADRGNAAVKHANALIKQFGATHHALKRQLEALLHELEPEIPVKAKATKAAVAKVEPAPAVPVHRHRRTKAEMQAAA